MPPEPDPEVDGRGRPGSRAVAFFDVDNTLVRGASAFHLLRELYRRRFFTVGDTVFFGRHLLRYFLGGEDVRRMGPARDRALGIMRGRPVAEIVAIAEEVYDEVLASTVFPGTRALLESHLAQGHDVWLITASPREIGHLVADRLGATGAVGTVAEQRDGVYTGRLQGSLMHGDAKAGAARRIAEEAGVDLAHCFAYGDSVNDIPMLEAVGFPCAINPEPQLRMHALDVGWPVRDFRRRRSSIRRKAAGAVGALGLGGAAAWAARRAVRSRTGRASRGPGA